MKIGFLLIIAIFFVIEDLEGNFLLVDVGDKVDAGVVGEDFVLLL